MSRTKPATVTAQEAIAWAMAEANSGPVGSQLFAIHWGEFGAGYMASAAVALRTLETPRPEMIAAAWLLIDAEKRRSGIGRLGPGLGATDVWRAMIRQAVNDIREETHGN